MKLAAYQFGVTGDMHRNMNIICKAVELAAQQKAELIIFPECAITGYPPRDIDKADNIDRAAVETALDELQRLSDSFGISIIAGTVIYDEQYYNRAYVFIPGQSPSWYGKRALYGWDEDNFVPGKEIGIFKIGECTVGVRICFEVRFPEYFRELYREHTDLNIVLFFDAADSDDTERYNLIRSHLLTRAVENVTPFLSVNAITSFQTAPTCFVDPSGRVLAELKRNTEGLLIYDYEKSEPDFGEKGRLRYSDALVLNEKQDTLCNKTRNK